MDEFLEYFTKRADKFFGVKYPQEADFKNRQTSFEFYTLYNCKQVFFFTHENNEYLSYRELLEIAFRSAFDLEFEILHEKADSQLLSDFFKEDYILPSGNYLNDMMYENCLYDSLCLFLHNTKRLSKKHMTLIEFVRKNSPIGYNIKDSAFYSPVVKPSDTLVSDATTLRQFRHRTLSKHDVRADTESWHGMTGDSEFEWTDYFNISSKDMDPTITDTFKRFGNLYNEIQTIRSVKKEDVTYDQVINAYRKFCSKLSKIKYCNYIKTWEYHINRIYEEKTHFSINIHRFEKLTKFFEISRTVNRLLECKTQEEKNEILGNDFILDHVWLPRVYEEIRVLDRDLMFAFSIIFEKFLSNVYLKSRFIIDEMIEKGLLGEDWERLFYEILDSLIPQVFYLPPDLDLTIRPGAEEEFHRLLKSNVQNILQAEFRVKLE